MRGAWPSQDIYRWQQHGVDNGEDRGVCTSAEREHDDHDGTDEGLLSEQAKGVTQIGEHEASCAFDVHPSSLGWIGRAANGARLTPTSTAPTKKSDEDWR
jgi:hypothetical protein